MPQANNEIITRADLNYNNDKLVEWVRRYVKDNQADIDIESEVLRLLDEINNEVVGSNGSEKAQYTLEQRELIYGILQGLGHDTESLSLKDSVNIIRAEIEGRGAFILDEYGERWTASAWAYEKEKLGKNPAIPLGVLLVTTTQTRLIALEHTSLAWGTSNYTVPNLSTDQSVLGDDEIIAEQNTREIIKYANPMVIWEWEESQDIEHKDVLWFETKAEADADAKVRYATEPTTVTQTDVYMVGVNGGTIATYYWNGTALTQRLASVPLVDNKNFIGAPAAEYCYNYGKTFAQETSRFSWHLPDGREYLQLALNRSIINECRHTLGFADVTTLHPWICLQYSAPNACCGSGTSLGNVNKYCIYHVLPFAILKVNPSI